MSSRGPNKRFLQIGLNAYMCLRSVYFCEKRKIAEIEIYRFRRLQWTQQSALWQKTKANAKVPIYGKYFSVFFRFSRKGNQHFL